MPSRDEVLLALERVVKSMPHFLIGTSLILLAASHGTVVADSVKDSQCRATYIYASDQPQAITTSFAKWTVQAILIGCRSDLESIDSEQRRRVLEAIRVLFVESDLHLLMRLKTPAFRDEAVKRINIALGRSAVSDIAFMSATRSE